MVKAKNVLIILLMFLVFLLNSCGSMDKGNEKLILYSNLTNSETDVIKELVCKWGDENNIKVKVSNDESDYDASDIVYGGDYERFQNAVKNQEVDEVPYEIIQGREYNNKKIEQAMIKDNKTYGIAISQETCALFYNDDYINKIPESMEDLEKIASKYKVGFQFDINDLYRGYGFTINEDSYGYEFLKKLIYEDKLMDNKINESIAEENFKNGQIGFFISYPYEISKLKENKKLNFGIAAIPSLNGKAFKTLLKIETSFLKTNAKNKDKAWKLIKYLNENNKEIIEKGNRIPVIKEDFNNKEIMDGFLEQIKSSDLLVDDEAENVSDLYKNEIEKVLNFDEYKN